MSQKKFLYKVAIEHDPRTENEIELKVGDVVEVGHPWSHASTPCLPVGWLSGFNRRTKKNGKFPSTKVMYWGEDLGTTTDSETQPKRLMTLDEFSQRRNQQQQIPPTFLEMRSAMGQRRKKCGKRFGEEVYDVEVSIGILHLKGIRLVSSKGALPVTVSNHSNAEDLLQAALMKHRAFDQFFEGTAEDFVLLYKDRSVVEFLPGATTPFILHKYRKLAGHSYSKIYLYICTRKDHKEFMKSVRLAEDPELPVALPLQDRTHLQQTSAASLLDHAYSNTAQPTPGEISLPLSRPDQPLPKQEDKEVLLPGQEGLDLGFDDTLPDIATERAYDNYISCITVEEDDDEDLRIAIQASLADKGPETAGTDILLPLYQAKFKRDEQCTVIINRRHVLKSTLRAIQRENFSFQRTPCVDFAGEEAEDYGGPRREYFRLLVQAVRECGVFEGPEDRLVFTYSQSKLEDRRYFQAGQLLAWSLAFDGPGLHGLNPVTYKLMTGQDPNYEEDLNESDCDHEIIKMLKETRNEIEFAEFIRQHGDVAADMGIPSVYSMKLKDKTTLTEQLVRHILFYRVQPAIESFKNGMEDINELWSLIKDHPQGFEKLMCAKSSLTKSDLKKLCIYIQSEKGNIRRENEGDTIYCWEIYLEECQNRHNITLKRLLEFITGADQIPPLGFKKAIEVKFYDYIDEDGSRRRPWVSTCALELYLPRGFDDPEKFKDLMDEAITQSPGFGKI